MALNSALFYVMKEAFTFNSICVIGFFYMTPDFFLHSIPFILQLKAKSEYS